MEKEFLRKGVCDCKIVIPKDADIVEKTAAEELSDYIEKSLSVRLPIVCEGSDEGKCIYVGDTVYARKKGVLGTSVENWIIKMVDGNLVLTGGVEKYKRGVIYSVYHFLEDIVGIRFWSQYEEDVLSLDSLSLDESLYMESTPEFVYRKPYLSSMCGPSAFHYLAKTRTNAISPLDEDIPDSVYDETVRKYGGARWAGRPHHVHTMGKYFPADEYFDEHPEWWAWNDVQGKHLRTGSYCFANEEFFRALVDKLLAYIKEDVELAEKTGVELPCFYSLSIDDVNEAFFCQCPECAKTIKEAGYTGYALKFVNKVAREVAKVYPWAKVEILAYANFIEVPKNGTLPEKNVIVQLADLFSDMGRGINSPTNKNYLRLLKDWSKVCKKAGSELYIYDYLSNNRTNYPLPIFYRLKDTITTYRDMGVKGIFVEAQPSFSDCWELNKYVLTHLLENPDIDVDALIDDMINRYFGAASVHVKEYFALLRDAMERNCMNVLCCGEDSRFNYIDVKVARLGSELLDKAWAAVDKDSAFAYRVSWLRKQLDAVIAFKFFELKGAAEAAGEEFAFDVKKVKESVIAALRRHAKTPQGSRTPASIENEIEYFEALPEVAPTFDIPEELRGENPNDIYQVSLLNMPKYASNRIKVVYGYSEVEDADSPLSKVLKLSYDTAKGVHVTYMMAPTSKEAETKRPIVFKINQDNENIATREYYKEDLIQNGYHLYKIGSVSGIDKAYNTRFNLLGGCGSINIGGIAVTFPMKSCDVYVSMKCTGEVYGGNPGDENAIYFDRLIFVRK